MKDYSMQKIKELWRLYKLPVYSSTNAVTLRGLKTMSKLEHGTEPGMVVPVKQKDLEVFRRFDLEMSFPEFIEWYEPILTKRKLEAKTDKLTR